MRYEITGTATDLYSLETIQTALKKVGACRVRARCAFGWSNQPRVATFFAKDDATARKFADAARATVDGRSLPSFIPHSY